MKKMIKLMSVLMLVCLGTVLLSGVSSAQEKIELKLKIKADSIVLQWNGSKKEDYYVYKKTGKGKFAVIDTVRGKKYTDRDVKSGETYSYCIKLKGNKKIKSEHKSSLYLAAPVIKKPAVSNGGITLKWNSTEGAEDYVIYRRESGIKAKRLGRTENLTFFDNTAQTGKLYTYTVKSVKGKTVSAVSKVTVGRLSSPVIRSLKRSTDSLILSWEKNESAESYLIYRKKYGSAKWKKVGTVGSSQLSFEDKKAVSGVKYSYFVKAASGYSISVYEGKNLSTLCLKAPADVTLKKDGKKIKLSWKKTEGADKYQIYKKIGSGKWKKFKETKKLTCTDSLKNSKDLVYYKVRAIADKTKGAFSDEVKNLRVDPAKPMVALTYDDGPHPINTHRILDVLEKHGARATFFVVGSRINDYSDCVERQGNLGCEVANHSFSHDTLSVISDKKVLEEIEKTDALIKKYSGQTPVLCRAPGGSVGKAAKLLDRPFIHWSVDTLDWQSRSSSKVVSHIKKTVRDGSIILMHDLYGSTADASEIIIPWLISQGYQLVTVSEMLEAKGIGVEGGRIYYNGYT